MKHLVVALFLFAAPAYCHGQLQGTALVDSLLKELPKYKDDTNKIILLDDIADAFGELYPDESIKYEQKELELAEKIGWQKGIGEAYAHLADDFATKNELHLALNYMLKSINIFKKTGNLQYLAHEYNNAGDLFESEKKYDSALSYFGKELNIYDSIRSKRGTVLVLWKFATVYFRQGNYEKALEYDYRAMKVYEELNSGDYKIHFVGGDYKLYFVIISGVLGEAYLGIAKNGGSAELPGKKASTDSAIKYLQKAIAASEEIHDAEKTINLSWNLADALALSGDNKAAFETIRHAQPFEDSAKNENANEEKRIREMVNQMNETQITLEQKQLDTEKKVRLLFITGLGLLLLLVVFAFKNFSNQLKANKRISKEKKRSDDLLLNILPSEVAEELKEKGSAAAKYFDHVTVLFTDFVGFTKAGERMSPQQLVDELDACFKEFDQVTVKHGIEKIKTIGDAYLAVCGLPLATADHAEKIAHAAIEIRNFMQERKLQMGDKTFEVRIGIHSGSVVAGIVGVKKFAYDIWGDTVNTAARMEQNSEAGKVNISQATYDLVKDKFACSYRGEIDAKNKGEMSMYFVEEVG